jgi:hypothetical protein
VHPGTRWSAAPLSGTLPLELRAWNARPGARWMRRPRRGPCVGGRPGRHPTPCSSINPLGPNKRPDKLPTEIPPNRGIKIHRISSRKTSAEQVNRGDLGFVADGLYGFQAGSISDDDGRPGRRKTGATGETSVFFFLIRADANRYLF